MRLDFGIKKFHLVLQVLLVLLQPIQFGLEVIDGFLFTRDAKFVLSAGCVHM